MPGRDPMALKRHAMRQEVVFGCRAGRLRISPHAYNNEEDLDRLVRRLRRSSERLSKCSYRMSAIAIAFEFNPYPHPQPFTHVPTCCLHWFVRPDHARASQRDRAQQPACG